MLQCRICKQTLPLDSFYESNRRTCKNCVCARSRANRWDNIEHRRAYDRARGRLAHRKLANKIRAEKNNHWHQSKVTYIERNRDKRAAHIIVGNAIRDGKLVPEPCQRCGTSQTHAHHEDYTRPFDVMWLCSTCHGARHREINEERRQGMRQ